SYLHLLPHLKFLPTLHSSPTQLISSVISLSTPPSLASLAHPSSATQTSTSRMPTPTTHTSLHPKKKRSLNLNQKSSRSSSKILIRPLQIRQSYRPHNLSPESPQSARSVDTKPKRLSSSRTATWCSSVQSHATTSTNRLGKKDKSGSLCAIPLSPVTLICSRPRTTHCAQP
ncbi:hypothetical protein BGZ52_013047, partial [Haplosporangium bisporale]